VKDLRREELGCFNWGKFRLMVSVSPSLQINRYRPPVRMNSAEGDSYRFVELIADVFKGHPSILMR
jgi:hypothetical protein